MFGYISYFLFVKLESLIPHTNVKILIKKDGTYLVYLKTLLKYFKI